MDENMRTRDSELGIAKELTTADRREQTAAVNYHFLFAPVSRWPLHCGVVELNLVVFVLRP